MKKHFLYWLVLSFLVIIGCQKELSFEIPNTPAAGSLQDDAAGDCLPKTINGAYAVGQALVPTNNFITVQVSVTKTGSYAIGTDTVNGYYFRGTGSFTTLGNNTVTLRGNGTPFAAGTNNFVVTFDSTVCDIQVIVTQPGVCILAGSPNACAQITVNGSYSPGGAMSASNFAVVQVNVTTAGSLIVTTDTVAGIWFADTVTLGTGNGQNITLQAYGTVSASATGPQTYRVRSGISQCTFVVTVVVPAAGTVNCTGATPTGSYIVGTALVPGTNTVQIQVNVTTAGPYTISTDTVHGIYFNASGNFPTAPATVPVTLAGNGTPDAAGTWTYTVRFGASTCTFTVTVSATVLAVFTIDCPNVQVNGTYLVGVNLTASNTIVIPITVATAGTYSINASINGMTFTGSGTVTLATTSIIISGVTSTSPTGPPNTYNLIVNGCSIPIIVTAAPVIDWSFRIGATVYSGSTSDVIGLDNTSFPPFTIVDYYGEYTGTPDLFNLTLGDPSGGVFTAGETYNTNFTTITNGAYLYFDALPALELEATDPVTTPGVNIVVTITSHNTATKTIIGTFAGTAFDYVSGTPKTITNGTFKIVYPN